MAIYFKATINDTQVVFEVRYADSTIRCSQMFVRKPGDLCSIINMDEGLTVTPVASDYWSECERYTIDSSRFGGDEKLCLLLGFRYPFIAEALKYVGKVNNPGFPARKVLHKIRSLSNTEDFRV